jgi:hypothetical protein
MNNKEKLAALKERALTYDKLINIEDEEDLFTVYSNVLICNGFDNSAQVDEVIGRASQSYRVLLDELEDNLTIEPHVAHSIISMALGY